MITQSRDGMQDDVQQDQKTDIFFSFYQLTVNKTTRVNYKNYMFTCYISAVPYLFASGLSDAACREKKNRVTKIISVYLINNLLQRVNEQTYIIRLRMSAKRLRRRAVWVSGVFRG